MQKENTFTMKTELIEEFSYHLYSQEKTGSTIRKYSTDLKTFLKYLGPDRQVSRIRLLEYKEWLRQKYAVSSTNSMLAAVNCFLDYMCFPELKVKSYKVQKRMFLDSEKEMTKKEYRKLVETARKKEKNQLALILEAICATGVRVSELKYLTVKNLQYGRLEVCNKGKTRIVLIPESLRKKLLCYAGKQGIKTGPVFVTRNGRPKDRSNIWTEMKVLAEQAGIKPKKVFPHNLRHLFARSFYKATNNLAALADVLGHSSLEVTRIYTADTLKKFQGMIEQLDLIVP